MVTKRKSGEVSMPRIGTEGHNQTSRSWYLSIYGRICVHFEVHSADESRGALPDFPNHTVTISAISLALEYRLILVLLDGGEGT